MENYRVLRPALGSHNVRSLSFGIATAEALNVPQAAFEVQVLHGMGEPIARYLIGRGFAVTGLDSSPSLVALCRERFPAAEWVVGDMREMALGRRFDGTHRASSVWLATRAASSRIAGTRW